jgi:hypothetical protein
MSGGGSSMSVRISIFLKFLSYRTRSSVFSSVLFRLVGVFCLGYRRAKSPRFLTIFAILWMWRFMVFRDSLAKGELSSASSSWSEPADARVLRGPEEVLFYLLFLRDVFNHYHVSLLDARKLAYVPLENHGRRGLHVAGDLALSGPRDEDVRSEALKDFVGVRLHGVPLFHAGYLLHRLVPVLYL